MLGELSLKEAVIAVIQDLPDNCTLDDIIKEIKAIAALVRGFNEVEKGHYITPEELIKRTGEG